MALLVGTVLYGFCGGYFGDSYEDKRVEAVGADWVVVRDTRGELFFVSDAHIHEELQQYRTREPEYL